MKTHKLKLAVGALVILLITLLVIGFITYISGLGTGSKIQTVSQLVLIGVTGVYVLLNYWLVQETKRTRTQSVRPFLNIEVSSGLGIGIVNMGRGPAYDVDVTLTLEKEANRVLSDLIRSEPLVKFDVIIIPTGDFVARREGEFKEITDLNSDIYEDYDIVRAKGKYNDMRGNIYWINNDKDDGKKFPLEHLATNSGKNLSRMHLDRIADNTKNIADNIKR